MKGFILRLIIGSMLFSPKISEVKEPVKIETAPKNKIQYEYKKEERVIEPKTIISEPIMKAKETEPSVQKETRNKETYTESAKCEVCEKSGTELEIWYDSNNIKHYTCLVKCTDGLDILYGPNVQKKQTDDKVEVKEDTKEYVYWNGGSSTSNKYHRRSNCSGMKGAVKMTREEARSKGYVGCKKCY